MANSKFVKLTDLIVNTENYRFESVGSQKEAIDKMIAEQGVKLFNLAKHIMQNGLNPNDRIQLIVSNHDKRKYIVLEGNRRTVSLKLLSNPDLIEGSKNASLKKKYKKLQEEYKLIIPKTIECTIYDNPIEANKWIKIKHVSQDNGVGTVAWDGQQVQRYEEKVEGKSSIALQIINILQNSSQVSDELKNKLVDLPITNLDRLVSDPDVRRFLGIEINNGILRSEIESIEVEKGLAQIAKDLLNPRFSVKDIYTKDDRRDYLKNFPKTRTPDLGNLATTPWQSHSNASSIRPESPNLPIAVTTNPTHRKNLIPKNCIINISNAKVNYIYHELQRIDVTKYPNAVAVLYRVFIELSVDCYIEKHKITNNPSSGKSGVDFQQKITQVTHHLETIKQADVVICKGIRSSIKDKNDLLGLDTWHAYVHNNRFIPSSVNLTITWDNMQDFVIILWNNII